MSNLILSGANSVSKHVICLWIRLDYVVPESSRVGSSIFLDMFFHKYRDNIDSDQHKCQQTQLAYNPARCSGLLTTPGPARRQCTADIQKRVQSWHRQEVCRATTSRHWHRTPRTAYAPGLATPRIEHSMECLPPLVRHYFWISDSMHQHMRVLRFNPLHAPRGTDDFHLHIQRWRCIGD